MFGWWWMVMNCFCGEVDQRKAFSLIFSQDHCQGSPPSWISDTPWEGFEPAQNLSPDFTEWSCLVMETTNTKASRIRWWVGSRTPKMQSLTFALENRENAAVKQSIEKPTIFCPIFCNHLSKIAAQCQAFLPEIKYWQWQGKTI